MSDLIERLRRLYVQTGMNYVQEAADEIEHLRAEVQRRREHIAVFDERYTQLEAERDELRRQLAEAEQDARRIDWCDAQWQNPIHLEVGYRQVNEYQTTRQCVLFLPVGETRGPDVRAAIDAAMELTRPAEE